MQPQNSQVPIQPNEETEKEASNNLINVVRDPETQEPSQNVKIMSPDELDKADKTAEQKANAMLAEASIKEVKDLTNNDDPYWHNSTTAGLGNLSDRYGFVSSTYQNVFVRCILVLWVIALIVYFIFKH